MPNTILKIESDKPNIPSDGTLGALLSATISSPSADVAVTWTLDGEGALSALTSNTNEEGVATVTLTSTTEGNAVITAKTVGDLTGKSITVVVLPGLIVPDVLNATEADHYILNEEDLDFGVTATVPRYAGAEAGQTIDFYWGDVDSKSFFIFDPATDLPYAINVSDDMIDECLFDGDYNIYYCVKDSANNPRYSSAQLISVVHGGQTLPTLPEPVVPAAVDDGTINMADANVGVEVDVIYDTPVAGDLITLYWIAVNEQGIEIDAADYTMPYTVLDGDTGATFIIGTDYFYPNGVGYVGEVTAYYSVLHADGNLEQSYPLSIHVDTVPAAK